MLCKFRGKLPEKVKETMILQSGKSGQRGEDYAIVSGV